MVLPHHLPINTQRLPVANLALPVPPQHLVHEPHVVVCTRRGGMGAVKEGGGLCEDLVGGGECVFVVRVGVVLAEVGLEEG